MTEGTRWEIEYEAEADEIRKARAEHLRYDWPHTWPISTGPNNEPRPTEWDPKPTPSD